MTRNVHFDGQELLRFRSGRAHPATARSVVRHLLSGCNECRARAAEVWESLGATKNPDSAQQAMDAVTRVATNLAKRRDRLVDERSSAKDAVAELLAHPPMRRWMVVRNTSRLRTFSIVEALLDASQQQIFHSPQEAIEIAKLAQALHGKLDPASYGQGPLADLGARVFGFMAHAQRAASRLDEAEASLNRAEACLEEGTGDPLEEAQYLYFRAMLLLSERQLSPALKTVDRALSRYRRFGGHLRIARVLIGKAEIQARMGDFEQAIRTGEQAVALFQPEEDLRLALAARHNLVWNLTNAGRSEEALGRLADTKALYHQLGDNLSLLKLKWVEGRLQHQLGRIDEALANLESSRKGLIDADIPYEAAVVTFHIAAIRSEQGQTGEVKRLAAEMLRVFQALHIEREAMAAWILFREAAEAEAVTATLLAELAAYFEKAAKTPGLKFRSPN